MNALRSKLDAEIKREGAIPFARFMELALYAPGLGYYDRAEAVGVKGDFYTSVSVGPVFGELLASRFARWLKGLGSSGLKLIEAGAHHGHLARDVLQWFSRFEPELFRRIEYVIFEPSAVLKERQQQTLGSMAPSIRWIRSWAECGACHSGIILSNELLDAFPLQIVSWNKSLGAWQELGVAISDESYVWTTLSSPDIEEGFLPHLPAELLDVLPNGFRTEISPGAVDWWRNAAAQLNSGYLLTLDYGIETEEFFTPGRAAGTLRSYRNHRLSEDVLKDPGEQDITAHVNFSKLREAGELCGLSTVVDESQASFLTKIVGEIGHSDSFEEWTPSRLRQFQTLVHPDHLGRGFRVLAQQRR
jgi:SAM-dependent MidA family methyltransferase